jgi:5-methylcytosine-specific restriction endonuclease McrA
MVARSFLRLRGYWATRLGKHPGLLKSKALLLKKQNGKYAYCGLFFKSDDLVELDHITPRSLGDEMSTKTGSFFTDITMTARQPETALWLSLVLMTRATLLRSRMT